MNILTLLLILAGTTLITYYTMIQVPKKERERERKRYTKKLGDLATTYRAMNRLRDKTQVEWFLIWRSHNGKAHRLYISVERESYEPPFISVEEDYQNLKIDEPTTNMLMALQAGSEVAAYTDSMPDGLIRRILESNGARWSYFFNIGIDHEDFLFGMIATSKEQTPFQNERGMHVEVAENTLRNLYKRFSQSTLEMIGRKLYLI